MFRASITIGAAILLGTLAACGDATSTPTDVELSQYLAGDAARMRADNGQFLLPGPTRPGEVTEAQARALALTYARTAGRWLQGSWSKEHGSNVAYDELEPCGRVFYAASAYSDLPETAGDAIRQLLGSKWLVTLCGRSNTPQVSVAIPTMASNVQVGPDGTRVTNGQRFSAYGIPPDVASVPPAPETAAEQVAKQAGRRVVSVPELVLRSPRYAPQLARWRVVLESPVTVVKRDDGRSASAPELYFGFGETWHSIELFLGERSGREHSITDHQKGGEILAMTLRAGYVDRFHPVSVQK